MDYTQLVGRHVNNICKNQNFRKMTIKYYQTLCDQYNGVTFKREDFEKLKVNGEELEQDIVKEIFKDKEVASAEEVFYNYFKRLNDIRLTTRGKDGWYAYSEGTIGVKKIPNKVSKTKIKVMEPIKPIGMSDKDWKVERKKQIKEIKKQVKHDKKELIKLEEQRIQERYQGIINHELSHNIECKIFKNKKYIKPLMGDKVFVDRQVHIYEKELTGENIKLARQSKFFSKSDKVKTERLYNNFKSSGVTAICEIQNETYRSLMDETYHVSGFYNNENSYIRKSKMIGRCSYNKNFDIQKLIALATGLDPKKTIFNSKPVMDKLSNLNISPEKLQSLNNDFLNMALQNCSERLVPTMQKVGQKLIEKNNSYETLCMFMGASIMSNNPNLKFSNEDFKVKIQDMLIESIKNDLQEKFNNPEIVKDREFFKEVNNILEEINKVIAYPYRLTNFNTFENYQLVPNIQADIDFRSINSYAKTYEKCDNMKTFGEMINMVKDEVEKYKEDITYLKIGMEFLIEQEELEKTQKFLEEKQAAAEKLYEETMKREQEQEDENTLEEEYF